MKRFLYLVQSRARWVEKFKILESEDSDCIIATYDEKVEQDNCIYIPQTQWPQGRNALHAAAQNRPQQYAYYIFLDDDLEFVRGDYRLFEQEVLHAQADFAVPVYTNRLEVKKISFNVSVSLL